MFRKRKGFPVRTSELRLRPDVDRRLQVPAVVLGLFVARLNAYEHGLMRLVAWFLGYYLGDPVLDWIIRVPHLIESVKGLDVQWKWCKLDYEEFAAGGRLSEEDCKVFLRIMYPRCRNALREHRWCDKTQEWKNVGAAAGLFFGVGSKIVGQRRRCGECSQNHPLRLLQVLEKRVGTGHLRHLFPYTAYIIRASPPVKYMNDLRSSCESGHLRGRLELEVDWKDKFDRARGCKSALEMIAVLKYQVPKNLWIEEYNRASHRHEIGSKRYSHSGKLRCKNYWIDIPECDSHAVWCPDPAYPLELEIRPFKSSHRPGSVGVFVPKEWEAGPVYDHVYRLPQ